MNFKQQTFITEYLRHRSAFTAYCLAYNLKDCSNYDSIMSSANRLLNMPEISSVIDSVLDGIRQDVEQQLRAEMKTEMLTTQRKRELLAKIATGETYAVQNYKGKDCNMCVQHVWPTINQMLKAIDLDNKMVGLYTSLQSPNKPKVLPATDAQVMQQVDKLLASMGIVIPPQENSTDVVSTPAPEKSDELATNHNNIAKEEPENSSFEGGVTDAIGDGDACPPQAGTLAQEKDAESQQSTTFISPTGLINLRTNRDHDGEGGTA